MTAAISSPIGKLLLQQEGEALCGVRLVDASAGQGGAAGELSPQSDGYGACAAGATAWDERMTPLLFEAKRQIEAYFAGRLRAFELPLAPKGSAFDRSVWRALSEIPYGEVRCYGELAAAIGRPKASRAVGGACSRNPLLIVVPCQRAVGATGKLTGFAAGMPAKRKLLALEGHRLAQDRIVGFDRRLSTHPQRIHALKG